MKKHRTLPYSILVKCLSIYDKTVLRTPMNVVFVIGMRELMMVFYLFIFCYGRWERNKVRIRKTLSIRMLRVSWLWLVGFGCCSIYSTVDIIAIVSLPLFSNNWYSKYTKDPCRWMVIIWIDFFPFKFRISQLYIS